MKRIALLAAFVLSINFLNAQDESQFKKTATNIIRAEFPRARMLDIEFTQSLSRDFSSTLFDESFQEGNIKNQKGMVATVNFPFYRNQKWTVTASGSFSYHEFEFDELTNISSTSTFQQNNIATFHNFSSAISTTYFSTLFKKPFIYNASVIVDGNNEGVERIKGLIGGSLILKRDANTTLTVGAIVFVDKTAQIPFFPTFSYNYKFKNSPWEFDFILPQRLYFRRSLNKTSRITVGSEFGGNGFYVNADAPGFPKVSEYSQLEIKSGLMYENMITRNLIITAKGGIIHFISNRLTEKGEPTKDYVYENNQDAAGYFSVGVSFNPFIKKNSQPNK